ncbi:paired amphipathic helix protein Sin3-like 2 [Corylus avellana]|uniref:paired amphipathic helix protein Sin3-like 2 n=1 Tax=Corylus avellana TaxID=13451 RepID=UPI00286D456C|nr:paired amphipathic helix protein Sin3-like 2 [Corylus avellana]
MEKSGLRDAMHFMNDVNLRFRHEDGVFKCFFEAINLYGKGIVDMDYLRHMVGALFEHHSDLLNWFLIFASDPISKKKEKEGEEEKFATSIFEAIKKHGLKGVFHLGDLLLRKIAKVLGQSTLREIFVHCRCFTSREIEKRLLEEFDDFLNCCEDTDGLLGVALANKSPGTKKRKRSPFCEKESDYLYDKLDFFKCQRVTPSYYIWPPKYQAPNLDQEDRLLNNCLRIFENLTGSGDSSRGRTTSEEEKLRDNYEDKRHELDMLVASMALATEVEERLMNSENPIKWEIFVHCRRHSSIDIEKSDLRLLAADVLRCRPGLLEEFDDFLDCREDADGFLGGALANKSPGTKKRKRSPFGEEESDCVYDKLDFSKCQRVTPSYYIWPPKDQTPNLD